MGTGRSSPVAELTRRAREDGWPTTTSSPHSSYMPSPRFSCFDSSIPGTKLLQCTVDVYCMSRPQVRDLSIGDADVCPVGLELLQGLVHVCGEMPRVVGNLVLFNSL